MRKRTEPGDGTGTLPRRRSVEVFQFLGEAVSVRHEWPGGRSLNKSAGGKIVPVVEQTIQLALFTC